MAVKESKYKYHIKAKKKPEDRTKMFSNYIHPEHKLFTYEYGWMRMDALFWKFKSGEQLNVMQFDLTDWKMYYTKNYEMVSGTSKHTCMHLRRKNIKKIPTELDLVVHNLHQLFVTTDNGTLTKMKTNDYIQEHIRKSPELNTAGLVTMNTIKSFHDGSPLKFCYDFDKVRSPYKGLIFGMVNETGAIVTMLNGKMTLLPCYKLGEEKPVFWH